MIDNTKILQSQRQSMTDDDFFKKTISIKMIRISDFFFKAEEFARISDKKSARDHYLSL